jgi:SAM-dependent methyltransferase
MEYNNYDIIADLYDEITAPATFDIDFVLKETTKARGEVLELMSGTGRMTIPLLQAGVKLTCVDLSLESNHILSQKLQNMGLQAEICQKDVCDMDLNRKFEMVIIPFHSFAHITAPKDQLKVLACIYQHLLPGGTFICTLGNPTVRQQVIDGQLRLFRKYPRPDGQGTLLLWIMENYVSEDPHIVEEMEFIEEYDEKGVLIEKRHLELHFRLTGRDEFEELAKAIGFKIKAFYGDYAYAEFDSATSPFMVWIMEK